MIKFLDLAYKEINNFIFLISKKIYAENIPLLLSPVLSVEELQFVADVVNKY